VGNETFSENECWDNECIRRCDLPIFSLLEEEELGLSSDWASSVRSTVRATADCTLREWVKARVPPPANILWAFVLLC
jgi:hypothetical protein